MPAVHEFSKNLLPTSEFYMTECLHKASYVLTIHKYEASPFKNFVARATWYREFVLTWNMRCVLKWRSFLALYFVNSKTRLVFTVN